MNFQENKPIFQQLADRICDDILLGKYSDHDRIPSVREYAATVEVNANTVMRTYELLQNIDIIYNRRGIGYFISPDAKKKVLNMKQESFLNNEIEYFFHQLLTLGIDSERLTSLYKEYCNNHKTLKK